MVEIRLSLIPERPIDEYEGAVAGRLEREAIVAAMFEDQVDDLAACRAKYIAPRMP